MAPFSVAETCDCTATSLKRFGRYLRARASICGTRGAGRGDAGRGMWAAGRGNANPMYSMAAPVIKTTRAGMMAHRASSPREYPRPTEATRDTSCRCYLRGPDGVRRLSPSGTWDTVKYSRHSLSGKRSADRRSPPASHDRERRAGGCHAVILRLLEERQAALIRMGVKELRQRRRGNTVREGEESYGGADHRVSQPKHIDARDAIANVGMRSRQIVENPVAPVRPVAGHQLMPRLFRRQLGERVVVRPDGALLDGAQRLVRSDDITQSWRIVDDVVPRRREPAFGGPALEGEIGGKPVRIDEIRAMPALV